MRKKSIVVHDDQHSTAPDQIQFLPGSRNDTSTLYNRTSRSSRSNPKSLANMTPYKGHPSNNISRMTGYSLQKYSIFPWEGTEPHRNKPHYEESENYHFKHSHGEKDTQI